MLISVGPNAEGEIPAEQEKLMLQLGEWTGKYAEAIYPTEKGIEAEYFNGGSTLSEDKNTLYLFVYDRPNGKLMEEYTIITLPIAGAVCYIQGVFLVGYQKINKITKEKKYYDFVKQWVDYHVTTDGDIAL